MKIEQEIQSRFRNEKHKLGVNLIYTSNWLSDRTSGILKKFDITMQQYNILRIIRGANPKPVTVKYIRERMLDKMSDVSRVVEKLREKKLINRSECPEDRRNVDITITELGLQKMSEIDVHVEKLDVFFDKVTDEQIDMVNDILDKIRS